MFVKFVNCNKTKNIKRYRTFSICPMTHRKEEKKNRGKNQDFTTPFISRNFARPTEMLCRVMPSKNADYQVMPSKNADYQVMPSKNADCQVFHAAFYSAFLFETRKQHKHTPRCFEIKSMTMT